MQTPHSKPISNTTLLSLTVASIGLPYLEGEGHLTPSQQTNKNLFIFKGKKTQPPKHQSTLIPRVHEKEERCNSQVPIYLIYSCKWLKPVLLIEIKQMDQQLVSLSKCTHPDFFNI